MDYRKLKSKKWCFKKALAASLAVFTAFSSLPAASPTAAKTAKPYVSLRTVFKTLSVKQTNRMTLKNNTLGWKIRKVATQDRTIAMVYDRTTSSFMIKGKSVGRATVSARLTTSARKTYNTKLVKCRVNVIAAEDTSETEASVSDQAALEKALQNKNLKKLEINTTNAGKLTIPKGTYSDTELTVNAPAADIENNGSFKSITIQAIKPDTWIENAIGNIMRVTAKAARIIVNEGARLEKLNFGAADAKVSLEVNGTIGELSISAKMELTVSGTPQAPIETVIEESAEGTVLESSAPLHVTAHASADITFLEGAENSTVTIKSEKADVDVTNKTNSTLTITKADGTVEKKAPVRISLVTPPPSTSVPNTPPDTSRPVTPGAVTTTGGAVETNPDDGNGDFSYPGGSGDSGDPGLPMPTPAQFTTIMNPSLSIVITRSALETTTTQAVTMAAILTLDINSDAYNYDQIEWRCPGAEGMEDGDGLTEWMQVTESKTITLNLGEQNPEELTDGALAFQLRIISEYYDPAILKVNILIYSTEDINNAILDMKENNCYTRTYKFPCDHVYDYDANGYYITGYESDMTSFIQDDSTVNQ